MFARLLNGIQDNVDVAGLVDGPDGAVGAAPLALDPAPLSTALVDVVVDKKGAPVRGDQG